MISLRDFETQWLDEIESGSPSSTLKGHRFAQKILRDWLELDVDMAEIIYCDGSGDGGIDAAVFIPSEAEEGSEGDTWMLVQSKYGSAFRGVDTLFVEANKVFATLEGQRDNLSSVSDDVVKRIRQFLSQAGAKDRLEYVVATNQRLTHAEYDALEAIRGIGHEKFGAIFSVADVSIETIYNKRAEGNIFGGNRLKVTLKTSISSSGEILYVGSTKLKDMFEFMQEYKKQTGDLDTLYDKNVRKYLGHRRKVNKGIEHTILHYPERFGLYNNGITIVAEAVSQEADNRVVLFNPYVVNGCQTTRSIYLILQQKLNSGGKGNGGVSHQQWLKRLDNAVVVTKIVVVGDEGEELLTETTRYTNSQNAVSEKDFLSLEANFRSWASEFNAQYGVFLEIQRGSWDARKAWQKQNPTTQPQYESSVYAFELLKVYVAGWVGEPGAALGSNSRFAPGGFWFKKVNELPEFDVEAIYAAYLLKQLADGYNFGRASEQKSRKQSRSLTRFLFYMVAIDLLRNFLLMQDMEHENKDISQVIARLHKSDLLHEIGIISINLIDDYFRHGAEDTLFDEPGFRRTQEIRQFLMSDKLGKDDQYSPGLKAQLNYARRDFRRSPIAEKIKAVLKED
ncbi:AIPR protein [Ectothiorhodospira magna]|uniref:AIPR protein n=1 Tax=Ectothiorhodospira magna TaxID=867345 RepID=A0A1H9GKE4_9GAMM|nr:AIPR family protein [Ectothiorhodospira magna]SEQ50576.1 AIPR protein [Ectothiorhodospira magna]